MDNLQELFGNLWLLEADLVMTQGAYLVLKPKGEGKKIKVLLLGRKRVQLRDIELNLIDLRGLVLV